MQKLYAKLCEELKEVGYAGVSSEYATVVVNNEEKTIGVEFNIINFVKSVHVEGDKIVLNTQGG